jgi:thymidylate synthase ThyX
MTVELIRAAAGDGDVTAAARVSTVGERAAGHTATPQEEAGLINYLMRDRHGCYDDETEVYTTEGWVFFPDVKGDETFLTLNKDTMVTCWEKAERTVHASGHGEMVQIVTPSGVLLVTGNHKVLVRNDIVNKWELVDANLLLTRGVTIPEGFPVVFANITETSTVEVVATEIPNNGVTFVKYSGDVHCVTVPNGTLLVRRKGTKPYWCGNSPFEHNSFTFLIAAPIFVFREFHRHRVGWCLPGDARIPVGRGNRTESIESIYHKWKEHNRCEQLTKTFNEETEQTELAYMVSAYANGEKPVITVTTENGHQLRCTPEHKTWTENGWVEAGDLTTRHRVARGKSYIGGDKGVTYCRVTALKTSGIEPVYDLEMPAPWHSFLADGFVVHNSYNEESGRYRELAPVFYTPNEHRLLTQTGKPGRYIFTEGTPEQHDLVTTNIREANLAAYERYKELLTAGVAKEVARAVLPVNIYSTMYATCNARSLMAFLSLRVGDPTAVFPSHPQKEIEMVAMEMEKHFATAMPLTHTAYVKNGRVGP